MGIVPILTIEKYRQIIGDTEVEKIQDAASPLSEKKVAHINSTYQGGGVAEILNSLISLMNDVGISTDWRVLHGDLDFFTVTKKFHNALQGDEINLSDKKREIYYVTNVNNSVFTHINHDFVIVHDPQPLPIITCYKKKSSWIWRCHIDISSPNTEVWEYLKMFIYKYDAMIVSMDQFKEQNLPTYIMPQYIIRPSINPLNLKNREISDDTVERYLQKAGVEADKPIICQVSRFDKWKDPVGLINIFKLIKEKVDCQLVMAGSMATDDPEGQEIFENLEKMVAHDKDIHLILNASDIVINSLQRSAAVVVQKSLKEGFAITVSEALWKGTPVVASAVGGIPSQVIDGKNGYVVAPTDYEGFAERISKLITDKKRSEEFGVFGKEFVKKNFLITRHLLDYINLLKRLA